MKIEKINDNQIRCTLNKRDLVNRQLKISELAYGSEKAKALFKEMMQQASEEFGFEADDIPLMIEAIPVSSECLILVITKVEDADELDTRFSKFSPDTEQSSESENENNSYVDEIINCFDQINEMLDEKNTDNEQKSESHPKVEQKNSNVKKSKKNSVSHNITKVFSFHSLDSVISLALNLQNCYYGANSLYKNPVNKTYYLCINKSTHTSEEFNKACNIITEYGTIEHTIYASIDYFKEHYECILSNNAIATLANI